MYHVTLTTLAALCQMFKVNANRRLNNIFHSQVSQEQSLENHTSEHDLCFYLEDCNPFQIFHDTFSIRTRQYAVSMQDQIE